MLWRTVIFFCELEGTLGERAWKVNHRVVVVRRAVVAACSMWKALVFDVEIEDEEAPIVDAALKSSCLISGGLRVAGLDFVPDGARESIGDFCDDLGHELFWICG